MTTFEPVLTRAIHQEGSETLAGYEARGGYAAARKVVTSMEPGSVIDLVKAANLRGRGGAGFPAGTKWSFVPKDTSKPKYLVVNADESEPGTFKDRVIIEGDPHAIIEGAIITAYAVGIHRAYIYIRGELVKGARILEGAIAEACGAGILGRRVFQTDFALEMAVARGAGAYICGEETGLLSSLEGSRGQPRLKPPFPAVEGLFHAPTVVNNVETLACVPHIIQRGPEWFRSIGPASSPGPKLYSVSGHVEKPGVYELPMGTPLREIIDDPAGGVWKGRRLKAVFPGGSSTPVLRADEADARMDFDSMAAAGSMLGSGGIIVMDETTDMVDALLNILRFYEHESCGQCTPCRDGTGWLRRIVDRIYRGGGRPDDLDIILDICDLMVGKTICPLADAAAMPTQSIVLKFRGEFLERMGAGAGGIR